jgi:hypothetical protein
VISGGGGADRQAILCHFRQLLPRETAKTSANSAIAEVKFFEEWRGCVTAPTGEKIPGFCGS